MCEFVLKADPERARRAARQLPVPCCLFKSCGSKKYGSFAQPQTDGIKWYKCTKYGWLVYYCFTNITNGD